MNKEKVGPFVLDDAKTTMKYGSYYKLEVSLPFASKRFIRVWLPEDYDFDNPKKRFPVIYFSDGQNLVNKYLTAYGDWQLDIVAHKLLVEYGRSFIAVGIDSPNDDEMRSNELNPPFVPDKDHGIKNPIGDQYVDYIVNDVKPLVDKAFYTLADQKNTAIGGSSMGGIMAFYAGVYQTNVFGFALCFSPAFHHYLRRTFRNILEQMKAKDAKETKFFFYVGGSGFEALFVNSTYDVYKYLKKNGFKENQVAIIHDSRLPHHESAWHKYAYDALAFWLLDRGLK